MIQAFWYDGSNVGDRLTPLILEGLSGRLVVNSETGPKWLMSGSILHKAEAGDTLCGVGSFDNAPPLSVDLNVLLVRGPRTAAQVGVRCDVYGDAGLLMPQVYTPVRSTQRYRVGVVPHYCDRECVPPELPDDVTVIPVSLAPREFIDRLTECDVIAASSLHGIVLAEAYGIPAVRIGFSTSWDMIRAFDFKHADYYEGTGRGLPTALSLTAALTVDVKPDSHVADRVEELRTLAASARWQNEFKWKRGIYQ